ncbi:MAG: DUF4239 domain-containing protein [Cyclobacteriaceae bacterium]|nr:DUF4239 domain-containing protein [Cyclobacteriaceae bacterium]MCK5210363.1 DUF4239 domain-containing protein [Cyclobacteriaceae bacterium]MCK5370804.1 DUF4239 domain-containing protein [Cyclobacteriaceae bacterium]MCK5470466.1 DUF4239 domain-containing protein [Cyclobacteriaceae bacterium]
MEFFFDWPLSVSLPAFLFVAVFLSLLIYLTAYKVVRNLLKRRHERTGRVLFRTTASLLALMLSLTFANQRVNYFKIKDSLESEASHLVDISVDLQLFGTPRANELQEKVKHYIRSILHDKYKTEDENPFFTPSVSIFIMLYNNITDLEATTPKQKQLKQNLLADIDAVSDFMQVRGYRSRPEPLNLIYIATFGFIVSSILFSVYRPDKISISFLSLYNAFVAIVLYFIIMMNNPMIGPLKIENEPFKILIQIANMN